MRTFRYYESVDVAHFFRWIALFRACPIIILNFQSAIWLLPEILLTRYLTVHISQEYRRTIPWRNGYFILWMIPYCNMEMKCKKLRISDINSKRRWLKFNAEYSLRQLCLCPVALFILYIRVYHYVMTILFRSFLFALCAVCDTFSFGRDKSVSFAVAQCSLLENNSCVVM